MPGLSGTTTSHSYVLGVEEAILNCVVPKRAWDAVTEIAGRCAGAMIVLAMAFRRAAMSGAFLNGNNIGRRQLRCRWRGGLLLIPQLGSGKPACPRRAQVRGALVTAMQLRARRLLAIWLESIYPLHTGIYNVEHGSFSAIAVSPSNSRDQLAPYELHRRLINA